MEKRGTTVHPQYDVAAAAVVFSSVSEPLEGEQISSPFDLYSVEKLRDEHDLRQGESFATDAFVLGFGPAPDRRLTKISGLPYWPKDRPWPTVKTGLRKGLPCEFLAQFCFLDSFDLVGDLPGEILLIFVPPEDDNEWMFVLEWVQFEWVKTRSGEALIDELPEGVQPYSVSEWYGVIHRSCDYPQAAQRAKQLAVRQSYNLAVLHGTKIGGLPREFPPNPDYTVDPATRQPCLSIPELDPPQRARLLCQLSSIQAAPNVPYPWTNRPAALSLGRGEDSIHGANEKSFVDMGSLYIYLDSAGRCIAPASGT